jgi:hypothetical protein
MSANKCIGKVTATENKPTTCTCVYFWLSPEVIIRPFDIVRIEHICANGEGRSYSYAIVRELSYITDSAGHLANYVSSDFGDISARPLNERLGTTIAEADVLGNNQNIEMPIRDGARVEWADPEEIRSALGVEKLQQPIPAGYIQTSNREEIRIDFEARYLVGPEAAHMNISGISGLASKTSYAMFLLSALQQRMTDDVSIILFNVKGPDLLAIDQVNSSLSEGNKDEWRKCGLNAKPLDNVTYLYPYSKRSDLYFTSSHVSMFREVIKTQISQDRAFNYYYDVDTFKGGEEGNETDVGREKMALLLSDTDDPQSTMESCIHALGDIEAENWDQLREEIQKMTEKGLSEKQRGGIPAQSWRKFSRLIRKRTDHDIFSSHDNMAYGNEPKRPKLILEAIKALRPGKILVIDIAPLQDYLQSLVFGDVIRTVFDAKLGLYEGVKSEDLKRVVIFADELNKYAPSTGGAHDRTLARWLLEITERGRSLGVVLFGAEQFRSGIHPRVLGNCSTDVFGRTNPIEISKAADYKLFSQSNKATVTRLNQGQMLLQHSVFNTSLIKVRFPYPAYRQLQG